ncbi:hypothetical protein F5J12DRAFT_837319 [Pisolithus orientalis]|uniref:uncharacterized protein n=1 Tax=Pisolithus orientalis TaxID=936130 RepID=UPI002224EF40|nr:uncharacterized protein F5J12DRAFT_837319 [Pisolithus orientalis]KAI6004487.1 hypothetical protein F5J12DRAFT_837319 [Pisolithus orientalis]
MDQTSKLLVTLLMLALLKCAILLTIHLLFVSAIQCIKSVSGRSPVQCVPEENSRGLIMIITVIRNFFLVSAQLQVELPVYRLCCAYSAGVRQTCVGGQILFDRPEKKARHGSNGISRRAPSVLWSMLLLL